MGYCAILQCKNHSNTKNRSRGGVSYHRFPKDAKIKEKWIEATGRLNWMPTKLSCICSEHFEENSFLTSKKGCRYLDGHAVPTKKIMTFQVQDKDSSSNKNEDSICIYVNTTRIDYDNLDIKMDHDFSTTLPVSYSPRDNNPMPQSFSSNRQIIDWKNSGTPNMCSTPRKETRIDYVSLDIKVEHDCSTGLPVCYSPKNNNSMPQSSSSNRQIIDWENCGTPTLCSTPRKETRIDYDSLDINLDQDCSTVLPVSYSPKDNNSMPQSSSSNRQITDWKSSGPPTSSLCSTLRKQELASKLRFTTNAITQKNLKIKQLQSQNLRLKKKVESLEQLLTEFKEKFALANATVVCENTNLEDKELIARQSSSVPTKKKYYPKLRSFALTLHDYSPKAYDCVRKTFNSCLPHSRSLRSWYSKIGGKPGFTKESLTGLKLKAETSNKQIKATSVIDEMSMYADVLNGMVNARIKTL